MSLIPSLKTKATSGGKKCSCPFSQVLRMDPSPHRRAPADTCSPGLAGRKRLLRISLQNGSRVEGTGFIRADASFASSGLSDWHPCVRADFLRVAEIIHTSWRTSVKDRARQANIIAEFKIRGCSSPALKWVKRWEKSRWSGTDSTRQQLFWRPLDVSAAPALQGPPQTGLRGSQNHNTAHQLEPQLWNASCYLNVWIWRGYKLDLILRLF